MYDICLKQLTSMFNNVPDWWLHIPYNSYPWHHVVCAHMFSRKASNQTKSVEIRGEHSSRNVRTFKRNTEQYWQEDVAYIYGILNVLSKCRNKPQLFQTRYVMRHFISPCLIPSSYFARDRIPLHQVPFHTDLLNISA